MCAVTPRLHGAQDGAQGPTSARQASYQLSPRAGFPGPSLSSCLWVSLPLVVLLSLPTIAAPSELLQVRLAPLELPYFSLAAFASLALVFRNASIVQRPSPCYTTGFLGLGGL